MPRCAIVTDAALMRIRQHIDHHYSLVLHCAGGIEEDRGSLTLMSMLRTSRTGLQLPSVHVREMDLDCEDDDAATWECTLPP